MFSALGPERFCWGMTSGVSSEFHVAAVGPARSPWGWNRPQVCGREEPPARVVAVFRAVVLVALELRFRDLT